MDFREAGVPLECRTRCPAYNFRAHEAAITEAEENYRQAACELATAPSTDESAKQHWEAANLHLSNRREMARQLLGQLPLEKLTKPWTYTFSRLPGQEPEVLSACCQDVAVTVIFIGRKGGDGDLEFSRIRIPNPNLVSTDTATLHSKDAPRLQIEQ